MGKKRKSKHPRNAAKNAQETIPIEPSPSEPTQEVVDEAHYRTYIDERKILIEAEQSASDGFDKNVLTLASGGMGLSLVFIEKIAPNPALETIPFLHAAWILLGVCIGTTLAGYRWSVLACRRQRDILEYDFFFKSSEGAGKKEQRNFWSEVTAGFNWVSIITFLCGAICLAYFSLENMEIRVEKTNATIQKSK